MEMDLPSIIKDFEDDLAEYADLEVYSPYGSLTGQGEYCSWYILPQSDTPAVGFDTNTGASSSQSPATQTIANDTLYIDSLVCLDDTVTLLELLPESEIMGITGVHICARDEWPENWHYEYFPLWIESIPVRLSLLLPNLKLLVLEKVLWGSRWIKAQSKIINRLIRFLRLEEVRFVDCKFWEFENVMSFTDLFPGLTKLSFDSSTWETAFFPEKVYSRISLQSLRIEGKLHITPFLHWLQNSPTHVTLSELTLGEVDERSLAAVDRFLYEVGSGVRTLTIGCNFQPRQNTPVLRTVDAGQTPILVDLFPLLGLEHLRLQIRNPEGGCCFWASLLLRQLQRLASSLVRQVTLEVWLSNGAQLYSRTWQEIFFNLQHLDYVSDDGNRLPMPKKIVHRGTMNFDEAESCYHSISGMPWEDLNVTDGANLPL